MKNFGTERGARFSHERALVAIPPRAVIGLEAEFNLFVNGRRRRPEKVFGDPSRLVRRRMIRRTGKSFQSPAGGAIYFDTGVIKLQHQLLNLSPAVVIALRAHCGSKSGFYGPSWITGPGETAAGAACRVLARITIFHFPMRENQNFATRPSLRICSRTFCPHPCFCWQRTGRAARSAFGPAGLELR